ESELKPLSHYAESKVAAEEYVRANVPRGTAAVIVRMSTVFGLAPRMRFNLLINQLVREAWMTGKVTIYSADTWRPYIHVQDAADAVCLLATTTIQAGTASTYNVGTENLRKQDIVALIRELIPKLIVEMTRETVDLRDYSVS